MNARKRNRLIQGAILLTILAYIAPLLAFISLGFIPMTVFYLFIGWIDWANGEGYEDITFKYYLFEEEWKDIVFVTYVVISIIISFVLVSLRFQEFCPEWIEYLWNILVTIPYEFIHNLPGKYM